MVMIIVKDLLPECIGWSKDSVGEACGLWHPGLLVVASFLNVTTVAVKVEVASFFPPPNPDPTVPLFNGLSIGT